MKKSKGQTGETGGYNIQAAIFHFKKKKKLLSFSSFFFRTTSQRLTDHLNKLGEGGGGMNRKQLMYMPDQFWKDIVNQIYCCSTHSLINY